MACDAVNRCCWRAVSQTLALQPFEPGRMELPSVGRSEQLCLFNGGLKDSAWCNLQSMRQSPDRTRKIFRTGRSSMVCSGTPVAESVGEAATLPTPFINLDQGQKEDVTIVELKFGDRLGALLDTMTALRALGVNVVKAKVSTKDRVGWNKFEITNKDGHKVTDPELVEAIRLTVIENLLQYHPESSTKLAMGVPSPDALQLPTSVRVHPEDSANSRIHIQTPDRPGLLLEIVKVLTDISVQITSADVHTEGLVAIDEFVVSYHGKALDKNMTELVTNALQFYLTRYNLEEDSY